MFQRCDAVSGRPLWAMYIFRISPFQIVHYITVQYSPVQNSAVQRSAALSSPARYSAVYYSAVQHWVSTGPVGRSSRAVVGSQEWLRKRKNQLFLLQGGQGGVLGATHTRLFHHLFWALPAPCTFHVMRRSASPAGATFLVPLSSVLLRAESSMRLTHCSAVSPDYYTLRVPWW